MAKIQIPGAFDNHLEHGSVAKAVKAAAGHNAETKIVMVPVNKIRILKGLNPRIWNTPAVKAHIESIGKSILANGYSQDKPMAVFVRKIDGEDVICLRDGHHRMGGVEYANKKKANTVTEVPVIFDPEEMSTKDMLVSFVTGNNARTLAPFELGVLIQRLAEEGAGKKEIMERLGITDRYMADLGLLMTSPDELLEYVVEDKVAATLVIELLKTHRKETGEPNYKKVERILHKAANPEEKAAPRRVTSKHLEPEDRPKGQKSAKAGKEPEGTSVATAQDKSAEQPGPVEVETVVALVTNTEHDTVLKVLTVMEAVGADLESDQRVIIDDLMKSTIELFGDKDLIQYAVEKDMYEQAGLVRLGLVVVEQEEVADPPVATPEKPKRKSGGKKSKATEAAAEKDRIEAEAADL